LYVDRVRHLVVPFLMTIILLINISRTRPGNDAAEFTLDNVYGDGPRFFSSLAAVLFSTILQTERAPISDSINSYAISIEKTAKADKLRHVVVNFLLDESEIFHEMCSTLLFLLDKTTNSQFSSIDDRIRAMSSTGT